MTGRTAGRSATASLALGFAALLLLFGVYGSAGAQEAQDCADFATQEEAQQFYDDHADDDPNDPDPFNLDTDQDGNACEGLPTSQQAGTASPGASPTASPSSSSLPQNGAETGVIALSGLSLLEAGYGLTLASKRLGIRRRSIPLYLMRRMINAAERGTDRVEITDGVYLVHRSALEPRRIDEAPEIPEPLLAAETTDERSPFEPERPLVDLLVDLDDEVDLEDDPDFEDEFVEIELAEEDLAEEDLEADEPVCKPSAPNVYAALAKPGALPLSDKR
jgi:hypothetical protein